MAGGPFPPGPACSCPLSTCLRIVHRGLSAEVLRPQISGAPSMQLTCILTTFCPQGTGRHCNPISRPDHQGPNKEQLMLTEPVALLPSSVPALHLPQSGHINTHACCRSNIYRQRRPGEVSGETLNCRANSRWWVRPACIVTRRRSWRCLLHKGEGFPSQTHPFRGAQRPVGALVELALWRILPLLRHAPAGSGKHIIYCTAEVQQLTCTLAQSPLTPPMHLQGDTVTVDYCTTESQTMNLHSSASSPFSATHVQAAPNNLSTAQLRFQR